MLSALFPRRFSRRLKQTAAVSVATVALAGGTLALAPTASAVGKSACGNVTFNWPGHIQRAKLVNLRSGPGTSYSSYGMVSNGTRLTFICYKAGSKTKDYWDYVKITSGPHSGTYGWVDDYYVYDSPR